jgi:nucleotide-binding universal stress UspA family protein
MKRVLIAVDDTDSSIRAARSALHLFGDDAEYTVISVDATTPLSWGEDVMSWGIAYTLAVPPPGYVGAMPLILSHIDAAAEIAQDVANQADLSVTHVVGEEGDAGTAIIKAAHEYDVDVIVIGSHDRSWFSRLLSPSTAAAVVRKSDIAVLVAP